MSQTKVSCNCQCYSEHLTIHTLRVKRNHRSTVFMSSKAVCNHTDKLHVAKIHFSIEAFKGSFKHLIAQQQQAVVSV